MLVAALRLGQLLRATRKPGKFTPTKVAAHLELSQNRTSHVEHHPEEARAKLLREQHPHRLTRWSGKGHEISVDCF